MKSYSIIYALLAFVIVACSKSGDAVGAEGEATLIEANYTLLQKRNGLLSTQYLSTSGSKIELNSNSGTFDAVALPTISLKKETTFSYFQKIGDCGGQVTIHDFNTDIPKTVDVFTDITGCNVSVTSITYQEDRLFIAYIKHETSKIDTYFVRILDMAASENNYSDVSLDKKPLEMTVTLGRLFILTIDHEITDENALSVVDIGTNSVVHEIGLGYDAEQIFVHSDGQIIIAYPELHTVLNGSTLNVEYIQYEDGKEPLFHAARPSSFDGEGKLYYKMPSDSEVHPNIPAVYDFTHNLATIYHYGNFLTETQWAFEYKIGDTTMVGYDDANAIMLVGYQKVNDENKGGLLRIRLTPEFEFIDNTDLEGVPLQIFY